MATLSGVDPQQYEAAMLDGANKLQRVWHITLPALIPTAVTLFILNLGSLMSVGFEKAFAMQNDLNRAGAFDLRLHAGPGGQQLFLRHGCRSVQFRHQPDRCGNRQLHWPQNG